MQFYFIEYLADNKGMIIIEGLTLMCMLVCSVFVFVCVCVCVHVCVCVRGVIDYRRPKAQNRKLSHDLL